MEACNLILLIERTQDLLHNGVIDNSRLAPASAKAEIQKLKGDDGRLYKLSVLVELYDPAEEAAWKPYLGND